MSNHTKKVLFISLIKSTLTYWSPIWRPQHLKDIQSIENVQRRVTKFMFYVFLRNIFKWPTSELAEVIIVVFEQVYLFLPLKGYFLMAYVRTS